MQFLKSVAGIGGTDAPSSDESAARSAKADTSDPTSVITTLLHRVETTTLSRDRQDSLKTLKSLVKDYPDIVGNQGLDTIAALLANDQDDSSLLEMTLEILCTILGGTGGDIQEEIDNIAEWVRDEPRGSYIQHAAASETEKKLRVAITNRFLVAGTEHLQHLLTCIATPHYKTRYYSVRLLILLAASNLADLQNRLMDIQAVFPTLVEVVHDFRDVIRYDGILALTLLCRSNQTIQKMLAFQGTFSALLSLIDDEHGFRGSSSVEDCLLLLKILTESNTSNLKLFVEEGHLVRIASWFQSVTKDARPPATTSANGESSATPGMMLSHQEHCNFRRMLHFVRILVAPSEHQLANRCRDELKRSKTLENLCGLLVAPGVDRQLLAEIIVTIADVIRGHKASQEYFSSLKSPTDQHTPLLFFMVSIPRNPTFTFEMKMAGVYFFESYLHRNDSGKSALLQSLIDGGSASAQPQLAALTAILLSGLTVAPSSETAVHIWSSCIATLYLLSGQSTDMKASLAATVLASARPLTTLPPTGVATARTDYTLLELATSLLFRAEHVQVRLGAAQLLCVILADCPAAVNAFLKNVDNIPNLSQLLEMGDSGSGADQHVALLHGICALIFGFCVLYNDNHSSTYNVKTLLSLVQNRMGGCQLLSERISNVVTDPAYGQAVKNRRQRPESPRAMLLVHEFAMFFKTYETRVRHVFEEDESGEAGKESAAAAEQRKRMAELETALVESDSHRAQLTDQIAAVENELKSKRSELEHLRHELEASKRNSEENSKLRSELAYLQNDAERKTAQLAEYAEYASRASALESETAKLRSDVHAGEQKVLAYERHLNSLRQIGESTSVENGALDGSSQAEAFSAYAVEVGKQNAELEQRVSEYASYVEAWRQESETWREKYEGACAKLAADTSSTNGASDGGDSLGVLRDAIERLNVTVSEERARAEQIEDDHRRLVDDHRVESERVKRLQDERNDLLLLMSEMDQRIVKYECILQDRGVDLPDKGMTHDNGAANSPPGEASTILASAAPPPLSDFEHVTPPAHVSHDFTVTSSGTQPLAHTSSTAASASNIPDVHSQNTAPW